MKRLAVALVVALSFAWVGNAAVSAANVGRTTRLPLARSPRSRVTPSFPSLLKGPAGHAEPRTLLGEAACTYEDVDITGAVATQYLHFYNSGTTVHYSAGGVTGGDNHCASAKINVEGDWWDYWWWDYNRGDPVNISDNEYFTSICGTFHARSDHHHVFEVWVIWPVWHDEAIDHIGFKSDDIEFPPCE